MLAVHVTTLAFALLFAARVAAAVECECGLSPSQRATVLSQLDSARAELVLQEQHLRDFVGGSSCSSSPPSPVGSPTTTTTQTPACTELSVTGYTPLFRTEVCANAASPDGSSHAHELDNELFWMPNGVDFTHGGDVAATTVSPPSTALKNAKRGIAMNNLGAVLAVGPSAAVQALQSSSISWTMNCESLSSCFFPKSLSICDVVWCVCILTPHQNTQRGRKGKLPHRAKRGLGSRPRRGRPLLLPYGLGGRRSARP